MAEWTEGTDQSPTVDTTGDARVDAVLASLAPLETAPVSEHVAVFESAIAQLRSALDDAGSRSS